MGESKSNNKTASISLLRIVAIVAVLFSHACSTLTENIEMFTLSSNQRVFFEICWNLTKWAVPCFFIITGALLLNSSREITIKNCLLKYARRMVLALFIFGIPFAIMEIFFDTRTLSLSMIGESILRVINGESFGHLWYLYILIGIYLALPFLKLFVNHCSRKLLEYTLIILFIFDFCIPFLNSMLGLTIAFTLPIGTYAIFYVLLGKYLSDGYPKWLSNPAVTGSAVACIVILVSVVSMSNGPVGILMNYTSPVNAVCTISVYSMFSKVRYECSERMWRIDRLCFGVYLIHPVFIHFTYKFLGVTPIVSWYPIAILLFTIVFTALSFFGAWVMSLIKPLRKYVL